MRNADMLDDVVLYDIMYEAGTRLGGVYAFLQEQALKKKDTIRAEYWKQQGQQLQQERLAINPQDRQAQISAYDKWNAQQDKLMNVIDTLNLGDR